MQHVLLSAARDPIQWCIAGMGKAARSLVAHLAEYVVAYLRAYAATAQYEELFRLSDARGSSRAQLHQRIFETLTKST